MNDRLWIVVVLAVVGGASVEAHTERRFIAGLAVAIAAGVLSPLLSDAIAFTHPFLDVALKSGTNPVWVSNIVLVLLTSGGALANVIYCMYKLRSNRTGSLYFAESAVSHWAFGILMGAFWYGGLMLYDLGEQRDGTVTGWPLFIGAMILSSNAAGFLTGEWKGADHDQRFIFALAVS